MVTYRISPYVEWRAVDDEVVLLDVSSELYMSLNDTGAVLWRGVAEGADFSALVERLVETFAVDREQAQADTEAFLAALVEKGLVVNEEAQDVAR